LRKLNHKISPGKERRGRELISARRSRVVRRRAPGGVMKVLRVAGRAGAAVALKQKLSRREAFSRISTGIYSLNAYLALACVAIITI
jgi:hypothetical protein